MSRRALLVILAFTPACSPPPAPNVPRSEPWWVHRHGRLVDRASRGGVDLLFVGDSLIQGWQGLGRTDLEGDGLEIWTREYLPRRAANFGMSGDRARHLLWRLRHGELSGLDPRVVVVLVGTNDLDRPPAEVASGVGSVLDELRARLPRSRVLLLALLPRGQVWKARTLFQPADDRVAAVNTLLEPLARHRGVAYLDLGPALIEPDGSLSRAVFPDFLHLSREGYFRWHQAMDPTLTLLLGQPPRRSAAGRAPRPGPAGS